MKPAPDFLLIVSLLSVASSAAGSARAEDWPAYRHDFQRSGVTGESLGTPLYRDWTRQPAHAPRPAWPEPGREVNRLAFDYCDEIVVAGKLAYHGSSADHKVYAIDTDSGETRWTFFTEGPVRFAPVVWRDRLYVASDDGYLYCLSAGKGELLWRFRAGPRDERVFGNGQLISRWPLRAGVGIEDGIAYFSAGMWPNEGVFVCALEAQRGTVIWRNDTCGTVYLAQPHPPSTSVTGVSPQGYVLGNGQKLFLPTGRNVPAAFDRENGRLLYYHSRPNTWGDRWGGSWNMLAGDLLLNWRCHVGPDTDVMAGEYPPDPQDGIVAFDLATGKVKRDFPGKLQAVLEKGTLYMAGSGSVTAYDFSAWKSGQPAARCTKWKTPHGRAYCLILAGKTLFVGGRDSITAMAADDGTILWSDDGVGQIRSLVVANGKLLASTHSGQTICYSQRGRRNPRTIAPRADASALVASSTATTARKRVRSILERAGRTDGYCLVLGSGDGMLLHELAKNSNLQIHCVEPDARRVATVRRALDAAHLYGTRVVVHQGSIESVIYPEYFADLILIPAPTAELLARAPAADLYRLLHPYGGRLEIVTQRSGAGAPMVDSASVRKWLREGKVPEKELVAEGPTVDVIRGALPGARNWTHQYADAARSGCSLDERARVPLKLLWFGEPGPQQLISRHWKGPSPLSVNGRLFVVGQKTLFAVDAYNGRQLWQRQFPQAGRFPVNVTGSNVAADQDSVYLVTGNECLHMDAATGQTVAKLRAPDLPDSLAEKGSPATIWSYLAIGRDIVVGSLGDGRAGRCIFALDKHGARRWLHTAQGVVGNNAVSMDDSRIYLIDRTRPEDVERARRRGQKLNAMARILALDAATGQTVWQTSSNVSGRSELWLSEGVLLATGGNRMVGYDASNGHVLYDRPVSMRRPPVIVQDTIYLEPLAYDLHTGKPKTRENPLSGSATNWTFSRSYGCGSITAGRNLLLFRSSTLGIEDLVGDTGVHNFGGVRAGCYMNAIAANGLVTMPTSDSGCTCSYSFQSTIALVPADRQEDWSVFYDRLPRTRVNHVFLNLAAPGDQRDSRGALWLAAPRPSTTSGRRDIGVPFRLAATGDVRTYRENADLVSIEATERPWVYASGLLGPLRAELDLEVFDRGVCAWPSGQPVVMDGGLGESCWNGYKAVSAGGGQASATVRYDDQNLYVAYDQPARKDRRGEPIRWKATASGNDASVWNDDSFSLYLSDTPAGRDEPSKSYVHLAVSASGARYDAAWKYVTPALPERAIPRAEITIDGKADDWAGRGLEVTSLPGPDGMLRAPKDFDPSFRIAWSGEGILLLARVRDNVVMPAAGNLPLHMADSLEMMVTPRRGSSQGLRVVIAPDATAGSSNARSGVYDVARRSEKPDSNVQLAAVRTADGYLAEVCVPWTDLGIAPAEGATFAMQLLVNDRDSARDKGPFQARWHPAGDPAHDALAYQTFRLGSGSVKPLIFQRSPRPGGDGLFAAVAPTPFPVTLPPLGAEAEDTGYAGKWSSAAKLGTEKLTCELAVPWRTLAAAGLHRDRLMVSVSGRRPLADPPVLGRGFERLILVPKDSARPRTVSVRLHFAELQQVSAGQRVFDIKIQGQVVLSDFDVVAAAGGAHRAVVKQFDGIVATGAVRIELVPKSIPLTDLTAPIISGIEILGGTE